MNAFVPNPVKPPETGDMMVMTIRVPASSADDLTVTASGGVVRVIGPEDFRHEVTMINADLERLHAQLYRGILELRAPHSVDLSKSQVVHAVPVETLS
jgi:HSP20 family molecular chaperone IbpA